MQMARPASPVTIPQQPSQNKVSYFIATYIAVPIALPRVVTSVIVVTAAQVSLLFTECHWQ